MATAVRPADREEGEEADSGLPTTTATTATTATSASTTLWGLRDGIIDYVLSTVGP